VCRVWLATVCHLCFPRLSPFTFYPSPSTSSSHFTALDLHSSITWTSAGSWLLTLYPVARASGYDYYTFTFNFDFDSLATTIPSYFTTANNVSPRARTSMRWFSLDRCLAFRWLIVSTLFTVHFELAPHCAGLLLPGPPAFVSGFTLHALSLHLHFTSSANPTL
jgi:hypothetical protein